MSPMWNMQTKTEPSEPLDQKPFQGNPQNFNVNNFNQPQQQQPQQPQQQFQFPVQNIAPTANGRGSGRGRGGRGRGRGGGEAAGTKRKLTQPPSSSPNKMPQLPQPVKAENPDEMVSP